MQPPFRKIFVLQLLVLAMLVVGFEEWMDGLRDRTELGPKAAWIDLKPVSLPPTAGPLRLAGAWKLTSEDPRFGGISAMAVHDRQLLAITDSGAILRFAMPAGTRVAATITELPDGPGDPRFKSSRDAESLVRDPAGRGWWVGFENRHSLWLFDSRFTRTLARIELGRERWHRNGGAEGLATAGPSILALPERGDAVLELRGGSMSALRIIGARGRIADAAPLPHGRLGVIQRHFSVAGFRNSLGSLERVSGGYRYTEVTRLPVSPLDNVEALAAEPLTGGATRLWMMTDDNMHAPLRTLLIAYDLPPQRLAH